MGAVTVKAVSDSGPFIHLHEAKALSSLDIFESVLIPPEVESELGEVQRFGNRVKKVELTSSSKEKAYIFSEKFSLDLGESEALALAKQINITIFLTDDLEAREAANYLSLEPLGSIGIIIASYKKKIISKKHCIKLVKNLKTNSTLFITQDLIDYAIEKIKHSYSNLIK